MSPSRLDRWLLAAAAALATAALASGLGRTDLWPPDEPRVAEIAREMAADGRWLVPTINGHPFLEEPPLFYWLQAATYRVAGEPSTAAARFPAALAAVAGAGVTAVLAASLGADPLLAVVVLATAPEYWWMAHSATPDTAAAAAAALALTAFFAAWRSGRRALLALAAGALGVAFGCKSLLPVGLAVLAVTAFLVTTGWGRLRPPALALAVVTAAVVPVVWVSFLVVKFGAAAAGSFLFANHLGRLVGRAEEGHVRAALYYVFNLVLDFFPWVFVLPAAVAGAWRERDAPERWFPLLWAAIMTAALTLAASKRAHYLLAAYPGFAVLVAQWWPGAWRERAGRAVPRLMLALLVLAGPALTLVLASVPAEQITMIGSRAPAAWADAIRAWSPTRSAILASTLMALGGLVLVRTDRGGNPSRSMTALAVYLTGMHLLLTLAVLPRLNPLSTARIEAERLGVLADRGVGILVLGSEGSETLSPILFYARRQLEEINDAATLAIRLRAGPTCALVRASDHTAPAAGLPGSAVPLGVPPKSRFVIVESAPGLCTGGLESARPRGS